MEYAASFMAVYPYRCDACNHRFLRFRSAGEAPVEDANPSVAREIQSTRRNTRCKSRRREFLLYGVGLLLFVVFLYAITRDGGLPSEQ